MVTPQSWRLADRGSSMGAGLDDGQCAPRGRRRALEADRCHNRAVSTATAPDQTTPVRIHADRSAGTLEIDWTDGHRSTFEAVGLRWLCPCAYCRGEAGLPGWLDTLPTLTAEQTRLVDVHLVGSYAIAPSWGDGHHTGYYPFVLLRDRCPCAACAAARSTDPSPRSPEVTR
jgi:DUF971 family protein